MVRVSAKTTVALAVFAWFWGWAHGFAAAQEANRLLVGVTDVAVIATVYPSELEEVGILRSMDLRGDAISLLNSRGIPADSLASATGGVLQLRIILDRTSDNTAAFLVDLHLYQRATLDRGLERCREMELGFPDCRIEVYPWDTLLATYEDFTLGSSPPDEVWQLRNNAEEMIGRFADAMLVANPSLAPN